MQRSRWGLVVAFVLVTTLLPTQIVAAQQLAQPIAAQVELSPYWPDAVQQWEDLIVEYANTYGIDPDLIASLIWKESRGRANARGPAGATGLMMVMPYEAGFTWRPTSAQLAYPETNIAWGTRTLSIILQQAQGDIYNALAAYNGGWERIHRPGPSLYATEILSEYARAVAMRCELPTEGHWVATVATVDVNVRNVLTVMGPQRTFTRYTSKPAAARIPDVITSGSPTALVSSPSGEASRSPQVGIWIHVDGAVVYQGGATEPPAAEDLPGITLNMLQVWTPQETLKLRWA